MVWMGKDTECGLCISNVCICVYVTYAIYKFTYLVSSVCVSVYIHVCTLCIMLSAMRGTNVCTKEVLLS